MGLFFAFQAIGWVIGLFVALPIVVIAIIVNIVEQVQGIRRYRDIYGADD